MKSVAILFTAGACLIIMKWPTGSDKSTATPEIVESISKPARKPAAVASAIAVTPTSAIEAAILTEKLGPREEALFSTPDRNPWERKLKIGLVARLHSDRIPGGENLGGHYVEEMKKDPKAAFEAIRSLLGKLSPREFPLDRASLIDVAGDLPGFRKEAIEIARAELRTSVVEPKPMPTGGDVTEEEMNAALTSDDFDLLPMVSHAVLMRSAVDREEALFFTLEAIQAQRDLGIRETIANQFLAKYPDGRDELYGAIQVARIDMPKESEN